MWAPWTHRSRLPSEKLPRGDPEEVGASQELSPTKSAGVVAAAVQPSAAVIYMLRHLHQVWLSWRAASIHAKT